MATILMYLNFVLVVSSSELMARQMFGGTNVLIYVDGRHHLEATLVSCSFVEDLSLLRLDAGLMSCPPCQTLL